jgi:hypothetical protein
MSDRAPSTALLAAGVAAGAALGAAATYGWLSTRVDTRQMADVEVFERHGPSSNRSAHSTGGRGGGAGPSSKDESNPTGESVVAGEGLSDPSGARRRLSLDRSRGPVIIGVAGASGSGKTSIAELLAERLSHIRVTSISSDLYYKSMPHNVDPAEYNFDQ